MIERSEIEWGARIESRRPETFEDLYQAVKERLYEEGLIHAIEEGLDKEVQNDNISYNSLDETIRVYLKENNDWTLFFRNAAPSSLTLVTTLNPDRNDECEIYGEVFFTRDVEEAIDVLQDGRIVELNICVHNTVLQRTTVVIGKFIANTVSTRYNYACEAVGIRMKSTSKLKIEEVWNK